MFVLPSIPFPSFLPCLEIYRFKKWLPYRNDDQLLPKIDHGMKHVLIEVEYRSRFCMTRVPKTGAGFRPRVSSDLTELTYNLCLDY